MGSKLLSSVRELGKDDKVGPAKTPAPLAIKSKKTVDRCILVVRTD